jgi:hypothetical protein
MNGRQSKQIRKILNIDLSVIDETQKRNYRRAKKQYSRLSKGAQALYLNGLTNMYNQ